MKYLRIFLILLLIPFIALAEDTCNQDDIKIESIVLDSTNGNIEETSNPNTDNNQVNLGLKMNVIDDSITYKLVITNTSNQDYTFDKNSLSTDYINYDITYENNSNVVKAGESKVIFLTVNYSNKPSIDKLNNGLLTDNPKVTFNLQKEEAQTVIEEVVRKIVNPETNDVIGIFLLILIISLIITIILFRRGKKVKYITLLILTILLTSNIVKALCTCTLDINTSIEIDAKEAVFLPGTEVNVKMKELAGDDTTQRKFVTKDYNIISIKKSSTEVSETNKEEKNIVSTSESSYPIYMWFDEGTIYWWSEDETPSLNEDASYMFTFFFALNDISGLEKIDTSKTIKFYALFHSDALTDIDSLKKWNVSNAEDFGYMFYRNKQLMNIDGIENWNVKNATSLSNTFSSCFSLEEINLSNWETPNLTNMFSTFGMWDDSGSPSLEGKLKRIILSDKFDTSKVTSFQGLVANNDELENYDFLKYLDTSNNTITYTMFQNNFNFTTEDLKYIKDWDMSKVTNSSYMFYADNKIESLELLKNWDMSSNTAMNYMFANLTKLQSISGIENWDVTNVEEIKGLFYGCVAIKKIDLSNWKSSKLKDIAYMFCELSNLEEIDISSFDTSNVTSFIKMFYESNNLKHIYVGDKWNTDANTSETTYVFPSNSSLPNFSNTNPNYRDLSYAHTGEGGYLELKTND